MKKRNSQEHSGVPCAKFTVPELDTTENLSGARSRAHRPLKRSVFLREFVSWELSP